MPLGIEARDKTFFGSPKYVLRVSCVTTCGRSTRSVRGSLTALGPAFPGMSQARDSEEIRRAILGLFACDLAGQTNSGSYHAREETFRCVAVVNSATRPLTLLEKLLGKKSAWKHASRGKEPESAGAISATIRLTGANPPPAANNQVPATICRIAPGSK